MSWALQRYADDLGALYDAFDARPAPGKVTITSSLQGPRRAAPAQPVQQLVVQRTEEEVYGTDARLSLPDGVTPETVAAARTYNDARQLRIDWVRRLQSHVRADGARTSVDGNFDNDTIVGVMRFQEAQGLPVDGRVTPATRRALEAAFPDLNPSLLGSHLTPGRVLVPAAATVAERYAYYRDIITGAAGVFLDQPRELNLLAIRGVAVSGTAPNLELTQTGSAAELADARAEDDAALADGSAEGDTLHADASTPPRHFSGRAGFDDVIISIWFELDGTTPVHHVTERRGSVDPASVWTSSDANPHPGAEGTSHLVDGQYVYGLGQHRTSASAHRDAVRGAYGGERAGGPVTVEGAGDEIRYSALVARRDIEVWRDAPGAAGDDHYPTAEEEEDSHEEVVDGDARYVDNGGIAINIHSSPASGPSSLGCQTVPTTSGYDDLIGEVRGSANPQQVYYTLIDASRVEAGLVLVRSEPQTQSGGGAPVQRYGGGDDEPAHVHALAAAGFAGSGGSLPHADAIQQAFGRHDVGGIVAHVGGAAASAAAGMGASAYASGGQVAFARTPDLHTAAHEAAHVLQQRAGVRLAGGVGQRGDAYEQHADAVADRVVRGESAEALIGEMIGDPTPAVQRTIDPHVESCTCCDCAVQRVEGNTLDAIRLLALPDLLAVFALRERTREVALTNGETVTFTSAWVRGDRGVATLRGELRPRIQEEVHAGRTDALRATIAGLSGDPSRVAELSATVDRAETRRAEASAAGTDERETGSSLVEQGRQQRTMQRRGRLRRPLRRREGESDEAYAARVRAKEDEIHSAMDVGARAGTAVYAPIGGVVLWAGPGGTGERGDMTASGMGTFVRLRHDRPPHTEIAGDRRLTTHYCHLSETLVSGGDTVHAGQAIGLVGATTANAAGNSGAVADGMGPHLHIAVQVVPEGEEPGTQASTAGEVAHAINPGIWLSELGVRLDEAGYQRPRPSMRRQVVRGAPAYPEGHDDAPAEAEPDAPEGGADAP